MFFTSIKTALKAIIRHPFSSLLNTLGFSLALAVTLLIALYAHRELTTNMFHRDAERIYKISGWGAPYAMGDFIRHNIPEVECLTNLTGSPKRQIFITRKADATDVKQGYIAKNGYLEAEPQFFELFSFPLLMGNPSTALNTQGNIVISEEVYHNLFPAGEDPIGQAVYINSQGLTVSGVAKNCPLNASIRFDLLTALNPTMNFGGTELRTDWQSYRFECFARVQPGTKADSLESKIQRALKEGGNMQYDVSNVRLYPLTDLYFLGDVYTSFKGGDRSQVSAMIWVGLIIMILAIINFFNLSTAGATLRTKEIGLRKINGGSRGSLIVQFIAESTFITFISFIIAFAIVNSTIPYFSRFVDAHYDYLFMQTWEQWVFMIGATVGVGLIAGSYPAFYLSRFRPLDVLYSKRQPSGLGVLAVRKVLIIVQLAATAAVILCTLVMSDQLNHLKTKDLGFDRDQIVTCGTSMTIYNQRYAYVSKLSELPSVENISVTQGFVGDYDNGFVMHADYMGEEKTITCKLIVSDTAFVPTFGIEILQGRNFTGSEQYYALLNEEAVRQLGAENPLELKVPMPSSGENTPMVPVVGIVKNFNFKNLHQGIEPLVIYNAIPPYGIFNIRVAASTLNEFDEVLRDIRKVEADLGAMELIEPKFLSEKLAHSYEKENKFRQIFTIFSLLSIVISCLGLFGLTVFNNARRTKEIALRRVHGSTIWQIIVRLSRSYLLYIAIALAIALPAGWYVMNKYLQSYPYRVEVSIMAYVITSAVVIAIMLLTVGLHSWRAASRNPAKTIKTE